MTDAKKIRKGIETCVLEIITNGTDFAKAKVKSITVRPHTTLTDDEIAYVLAYSRLSVLTEERVAEILAGVALSET